MLDESPLISLWPWPGWGFICVGLSGSIPCPGPHHSQAVQRSACCSQALKSTGVMGDLVLNWACLNKKPCALERTREEWRHTAGCCPDKQATSGPLPLCETQACEAWVRPNEGPFWVTYSVMRQHGEAFMWECYQSMPSHLLRNSVCLDSPFYIFGQHCCCAVMRQLLAGYVSQS